MPAHARQRSHARDIYGRAPKVGGFMLVAAFTLLAGSMIAGFVEYEHDPGAGWWIMGAGVVASLMLHGVGTLLVLVSTLAEDVLDRDAGS